MLADGHLVDGSWELTIVVTDLQLQRSIRVKGDLHIGGVMFKLVESLEMALDWSDHALWWPERNQWLTRTKFTLDQYGVQADARLWFTPMHKSLRVQLPDLRVLDVRVDFSAKAFTAVMNLCKDLGIRYSEELSFLKRIDAGDLKRNLRDREQIRRRLAEQRAHQLEWGAPGSTPGSATDTLARLQATSPGPHSPKTQFSSGPYLPLRSPNDTIVTNNYYPTGTLRPPGTPSKPGDYSYSCPSSPYNGAIRRNGSFVADNFDLANSPSTPVKDALERLPKPKNLIDKARINAGWLDSSLSLMEQSIRDNDILLLRFKFYSFYDMNPKYDQIRINQVFEQAKWSILSEEIDCTEEEIMMFAALQLQVQLQTSGNLPINGDKEDEDIDSALAELQVSLEGSSVARTDITTVPELHDYLKFYKPKKFTLKGAKRYWALFKDTTLTLYKSREEANESAVPAERLNLRGCEVAPDVSLSGSRFCIRLLVPSPEGMNESILRCDTEQQYARWMAACRLAAKGRTLADQAGFEAEVHSILAFLSMQQPAPQPSSLHQRDIVAEDFVAIRHIKKLKSRQAISERILEAHANVTNLSLLEAKLSYIRAWQALPEFGISYFVVRFRGQKKDELLGIAFNRMMRMSLAGDALKTWRFNTMKTWKVNWEVKHVMVEFDSEEEVAFQPLSADIKVPHEFIGGYIFLSMRSKERNESLNEDLFYKLTGGWV